MPSAATAAEAPSGLRVFLELDRPRSGQLNMERDRALLSEAARGAPPTLRLYRFCRRTLSLGHRQRLEEAAAADFPRLGIPWVRRPTGGRALLHDPEDLTYAFAAGRGTATGVLSAYRLVMEAIGAALSAFVRLESARTLGADRAAPRLPCLAIATGHELSVGGQKLVAGAQRWRRGAFLQHGSIPWRIDRPLTNRLAGLPADSPIQAAGLAELGLPAPPDRAAVAAALVASFHREFGGVRGSLLAGPGADDSVPAQAEPGSSGAAGRP